MTDAARTPTGAATGAAPARSGTATAADASGRRAGALLALVFTLASVFAFNPYQYGIGDTSISIPFAKQAANPALYPGDFMLAQRPFYYTELWNALGWLHARTGASFEALFFAGYAVALFFTFVGVHRLALTLFRRRDVAALALVMLLAGKHTLGSVYTIERVLSTREAALPLLLFALDAWLRRRSVRTGFLLGLAYLVHPITTHYALAMVVAAGVVTPARRGGLAACLGAFLVVASPLIAWRLAHTPPAEHLLGVDPRWLEAIRMRSANHMLPSTWDALNWIQAALVTALFGVGWARRGGDHPERHRATLAFAVTIVAMGVAGIVFSELVPLGVVLIVQPLRSFQFLEILAALYGAHALATELAAPSNAWRKLVAIVLAGAWFVAVHFAPAGAILYVATVAVWMWWASRAGQEAHGAPPGRALGAELAAGALAAGMALVLVLPRAGAPIAPGFSWRDAQEPAWLEVQRWARDRTPSDVGFIVPPTFGGAFRVESERTVYGDAEDGGLMNGNPAFGVEWMRRMRRLGMEDDFASAVRNYRRLGAARFVDLAGELGAPRRRVYAVTSTRADSLPFTTAFRNARYVVYEVTSGSERAGD